MQLKNGTFKVSQVLNVSTFWIISLEPVGHYSWLNRWYFNAISFFLQVKEVVLGVLWNLSSCEVSFFNFAEYCLEFKSR